MSLLYIFHSDIPILYVSPPYVRCLEYASTLDHVMDFTRLRALTTMFSLLNECIRNIIKYNNSHSDFPIDVCTIVYL